MYYDYSGGYGTYSADSSIAGMILVIYILILGALLIGAIVNYLFRGFGMYKMGKAEGRSNCWFAFVPFARTYFQGELGGEISFKNRTMKSPGVWLVVIPIIAQVVFGIVYFVFVAVTMVGVIGSSGYGYDSPAHVVESAVTGAVSGVIVFLIFLLIFAVAYQALIQVLYVLVNRQIYARYTTTNMAVVHAVLGTIIPFYESVCLFIFGRRAEQQAQQNQQQMPGYDQYPPYTSV